MRRAAARLLGRRLLMWGVVGLVASSLLGIVELGISALLQILLASLGLVSSVAGVPRPLVALGGSPAFVTCALMAIAVVRALGQMLVTESSAHVYESSNARLRLLATYHMLLDPRARFVAAAEINANLADTFPKAAQACANAGALLVAIVQAMIIGVAMLFAAPRETAVVFVLLGASGILVVRINRRIRAVVANIPVQHQALSESVERVARNITLVRTLRMQVPEHRRLFDNVRDIEDRSIRSWRLSGVAMVIPLLAGTAILGVIIFVSRNVLHTAGAVLLPALYLSVRLAQAVTSATNALSPFVRNQPQLELALAYVDKFSDEDLAAAFSGKEPRSKAPPALTAPSRAPSLKFTDVSFKYGDRPVVTKLSFDVPAGGQFAIIGPSGSGKSTILALALGLLAPDAGEVTIDGVKPDEYITQHPRLGYVGADPFLIGGTLRENLIYGCRLDVTDHDLWRALRAAHLEATVRALPGGLEYVLDENGGGLSAGQQQRVALARALLVEPQLLVLDEATANLDVATESEIVESIRALEGQCTTIIVSHRTGLLRHTTKVLRMGEDNVSELAS